MAPRVSAAKICCCVSKKFAEQGKTLSKPLRDAVKAVENELDPMFDPILNKEFVKRGNKFLVNLSDRMVDVDINFGLYFISRLPNPSFSPELQAKYDRLQAQSG